MKLIAQIKLNPAPEQTQALKLTLERINIACNQVSEVAWNEKLFRQFSLHKRVYKRIREKFGLSSQVAIRCIAKVTDAYKLDKKKQRTFKKYGSLAYDSRILTFFQKRQEVSIWVLGFGRTKMSYSCGKRQAKLLQLQQGESDLVYRKGEWFLFCCCNVEDPETFVPDGVIGVDLGVENIVVTSDSKRVTSKEVENNRLWYRDRRATLQSVETKSANRRLKQLDRGQANFQKDVNHRISKELVVLAKRTKRAIVLEDLTNINSRTRVRGKDNRAKRLNWSFWQLRTFVTYKAKATGVTVILIDPVYTSQRCNRCGHIEKANRKSQSEFLCCKCHHKVHADLNGARNIRDLGEQTLKGCRQPTYGVGRKLRRKPLALARGS